MPKKDTIQYRLYMKDYMSKRRASIGALKIVKEEKIENIVCFYHQLEHYKRYRKVLREIVQEVIYFEYVKRFDNVIEEFCELYPAYHNHITTKGINSFRNNFEIICDTK
jgi:hypothetical protein